MRCKTSDKYTMSPVRAVASATAVRSLHMTLPYVTESPPNAVVRYEVGHTGVTSPATLGPLPTMSGSDTVKTDTCLGSE